MFYSTYCNRHQNNSLNSNEPLLSKCKFMLESIYNLYGVENIKSFSKVSHPQNLSHYRVLDTDQAVMIATTANPHNCWFQRSRYKMSMPPYTCLRHAKVRPDIYIYTFTHWPTSPHKVLRPKGEGKSAGEMS